MPSPSYKSYAVVDAAGLNRSFDIIDISGCGYGPFVAAADNSYTGAVALAVDAVASPGRALQVSCTSAGAVAVQFVDGTSIVIAAEVGTQIYPYIVSKILAAGTTATATYAVLR